MKKTVFALLLGLVFAANGAAAKDRVKVERDHIWGNFIFKGKLDKNWGVFARYGTRYNTDFEKTKNGNDIPSDEINSWLNEVFIGPYYATKLTDDLKLFTSPQYRLQRWYSSSAAGKNSHWHHNIHWPTTLTYKSSDKLDLQYRLIVWNIFGRDEPSANFQNSELITRHFLGANYKLSKKLQFNLGYEYFWLHTADDTENGTMIGQQEHWRDALYAGITYKTGIEGLVTKFGYANYYTFKKETAGNKTTVDDNYSNLNFSIVYNWDFTQ